MSGREFGIQSSWHDIFQRLSPDLDPTSLRQGTAIAESMNQQIEEFINRYVVSSTNDNGDITFDAAGSYTFDGNLVVNGTLDVNGATTLDGDMTVTGDITLSTGGNVQTGTSGQRVVLDNTLQTISSFQWAGIQFYNKTSPTYPGFIGVSTHDPGRLWVRPAYDTGDRAPDFEMRAGTSTAPSSYIALRADDIDLQSNSSLGEIGLLNCPVRVNDDLLFGGPGVDDGLTSVTGTYGSVQTVGSGAGGYEGYSISGRMVFMHNGDANTGIYNDVDNEWHALFVRNSYSQLYDNGTARLRVDADTLCYGGFHIDDGGLAADTSRGFSYNHAEAFQWYRTTATSTDGIGLAQSNVSGTQVNQHIWYADGSTGNRLNSYGAISDERLKTDMVPYGDPRQDLLDIPVINYRFSHYFNRDGEIVPVDEEQPKLVGWGAQTVQKIKPGLVYADGENGQLQVRASVFVPLLHRAWQLDHEHLQDIEARLQAAGL